MVSLSFKAVQDFVHSMGQTFSGLGTGDTCGFRLTGMLAQVSSLRLDVDARRRKAPQAHRAARKPPPSPNYLQHEGQDYDVYIRGRPSIEPNKVRTIHK